MLYSIGSLLAFSFVMSLIAIIALIWAIYSNQFDISQDQARSILPEGENEQTTVGENSFGPPEQRLILFFFVTAVTWLVVGSAFGLISSLKLHIPGLLDGSAPLTFGRMRTMHLNSVVYGWTSLAALGTALWLIPTLFRTRLRHPGAALSGGVLWNLATAAGVIAIGSGWTDGMEWLEFPWQIDIALAVSVLLIGISVLATGKHRQINHIYVSGWYISASMLWFPVLFITANVPSLYAGAQAATVNWWYAHNVLGLWATPLGLAAAYYFIPRIIGKPIFSYRLSLLGFWALALFYSQVGLHHLVGGPIPTWAVTLSVVQSVMMVVPVVAVAINQHTLSLTNGWAWRESIPLRFVALGAILYTIVSLQGSLEAVRAVNTVTHFTHYTVGHAHLGMYGFVALVMFGAIYYMLPHLTGRRWPFPALITWHFWLVTLGITLYVGALTIGGWLQGLSMLDPARPFMESVHVTLPYLTTRSVGGTLMTLGHLLFAFHLIVFLLPRNEAATAATANVRANGGTGR
ncbi:cbb3-type cytochrome oxidase assembly protein CcoS [Guyparkeria hydrothermalis]|uniref:cbb3-type cytochrome oxidase assembly protein CcoS n=1 Tax=Guyparkeria hydrothermalis TaxID=923 RepID=UPI002020EC3A|nr:cbb3-type cytochrome oxidase assembly protein CcoS [Guyparkeria hydrothermalis]MCL7743755.1 cbb3-type cytochrome oxidase assembly protein CcoS [Guyparkeria hydrothermalis]